MSHTDQGSAWSLDGLPAEVYERWEAEAIQKHQQAKGKLQVGSTSTTPTIGLHASKNDNEASSSKSQVFYLSTIVTINAEPTPQAKGISIGASLEADSSITPEHTLAPRRAFKMAAALQSPYVEIAPRIMSFKCSKEVCKVYDVVCKFTGMATRSRSSKYVNLYNLLTLLLFFHFSSKQYMVYTTSLFVSLSLFFSVIIINYNATYATLGHLVESVKPRGKMKNTVVEIGIYVIKPRDVYSHYMFQ